MAKQFREWLVDERWLFPPSVRELVPEKHLAYFVRDTVREQLDLSAIVDSYSEERGYPPYHPVMMTALLLYSYSQGIYSSRRIAKACEQRVDFMAVTGMQRPDFRTVSDFRLRHLEGLDGLFGQVLKLCQQAGLVKLGHVALDGTKVQANASKHKAMSYGRMKKTQAELEADVAKWFAEAERIDAEEDALYGKDKRGDELPDWVANKQERIAKIKEAMESLEAEAKAKAAEVSVNEPPEPKRKGGRPPKNPPGTPEDKAQRSFTDPESRIMKGRDGFIQGYNCQAAVDAASQIIVAQATSNHANDKRELSPLVKLIKKMTGRQAKELSADTGYCSEENLKDLNRHHIRAYLATGRQKHGTPSATDEKQLPVESYRAHMRQRLRQGGWDSRYRLRKQTVEPVFGQIKEARGFRRFLMRGLEKISTEWSLICTAHDLLKLAAAV
jgi:transposase